MTTPTEPAEPAGETPDLEDQPGTPAGDPEPDSFPREYVEQLRTEAADQRRARRDLEQRTATLLARDDARTLAAALDGVLADPDDLGRFTGLEPLRGDDGLLDPERVTAAGRQLATERPHLAHRPTGSGPTGGRLPPPTPDRPSPSLFGDKLRNAAGR